MSDIIKTDFLGKKPSLLYNGSKIHKTLFGALLSLLTIFISSISCGYFMYLMFSRTSYNVIVSDEYNEKPFKNLTNVAVSIIVSDLLGRKINNSEKYFGIKAKYLNTKPVYDNNGIISYSLKYTDVELEPCKLNEHFQENLEIWKDHPYLGYAMCIQRNQTLNSTLPFGVTGFTGLQLFIHKCNNDTKISNCAPQQEIDFLLGSLFISLRFVNYYYNHENLNDPGVPYVYVDNVPMSSTVYKMCLYNFMNVEYLSDEGFIFPETKTSFYTMITQGNTIYSTDLRVTTLIPNTFGTVTLTMDRLKKKFYRKYYKAQNMIADLGGVIKGFVLISSLIYYFIKENLFFHDLMKANENSILNLYKPQDQSSKVKITSSFFKNIQKIKVLSTRITKNKINIIPSDNNDILNNQSLEIESKSNKISKKFDKVRVNNESIRKIIPSTEEVQNADIKLNFDSDSKVEGNDTLMIHWFDIFNPFLCFNRSYNYKKFIHLSKLIERQLEVSNIIIKLNMIDKLTYIFTGNKYRKLVESSINPFNHIIQEDHHDSYSQQDLQNFNKFLTTNIKYITKN